MKMEQSIPKRRRIKFRRRGIIQQKAYRIFISISFNPLNEELNPIRHLLALLAAHHILHVSRAKVKNILTI